MANYTTASKVAELLNVDVALIKSSWLTWADAEVESRTGKKFTEVTVTNKLYDGPGDDTLILDEYPITSITKIEYLQQQTPTEVWVELSSVYYRLYADKGYVRLVQDLSGLTDINEFEEGVQNIRVTYKYGYSTIPSIVELLASLLVAELYMKSTDGGISSEKIGDYSISYGGSDVDVTNIKDLITKIIDDIKVGKSHWRIA